LREQRGVYKGNESKALGTFMPKKHNKLQGINPKITKKKKYAESYAQRF